MLSLNLTGSSVPRLALYLYSRKTSAENKSNDSEAAADRARRAKSQQPKNVGSLDGVNVKKVGKAAAGPAKDASGKVVLSMEEKLSLMVLPREKKEKFLRQELRFRRWLAVFEHAAEVTKKYRE